MMEPVSDEDVKTVLRVVKRFPDIYTKDLLDKLKARGLDDYHQALWAVLRALSLQLIQPTKEDDENTWCLTREGAKFLGDERVREGVKKPVQRVQQVLVEQVNVPVATDEKADPPPTKYRVKVDARRAKEVNA